MKIYFQGAELPTYRNLILDNGVQYSSLSYLGLRKRTKFTKPWLISKYFPEGHHMFVDSGCQTLNNAKEQKYTDEELADIRDSYYAWIDQNIERIEYYTEFDAVQLGISSISQARDAALARNATAFVPVWGGEGSNRASLDTLAGQFGRVGILQTSIGGRDLVPYLNRMASKGIKLFGLGMTKPDIMQAIKWEAVSSTSWTSPQRYGDTMIWSHGQLKRYPKSMKDQGRKKEKQVFISAGFDWDKIQADDPKEMLRISLWSLTQLANSIDKKHTGVTTPMNFGENDFSENYDDEVGTVLETVAKRVPTARARNNSDMQVIPLLDFSFDKEKVKNKETGEMEDVEVPKLKSRSDSMRICDTCFLAAKCPMFEENSTCAYNIPIVIRTKEQMTALMDTVVEMQAQRVLFMKMAEDMEGGGADPNLSSEMDRLTKMMKTKHEMEQEGFSLTITAKQQGEMSMVDRIFGDIGNTKPLGELPSAKQVPDAFADLGFIDAEVIDLPNY